ncbi:MAG: Dabb family protein [Streptosporangiaceae bacterium]
MIRHVVLFTWTEEATDAQKALVSERLALLPGLIPQIERYEYGPGLNPGNADFALTAEFADHEAFVTYRDHPDHQLFIKEVISPVLGKRSAIQYELR